MEEIQKTENDKETVFEAKVYQEKLQEFPFVLNLILINSVFEITTPLSNCLQSKSIDFVQAHDLVNTALMRLKDMRSDVFFSSCVRNAEEFARKRGINTSFPEKRIPLRKKQAGEMINDERPQNQIDRYKIETFYVLIDTVISVFKNRFSENSNEIFEELTLLREDRITSLFKSMYSLNF